MNNATSLKESEKFWTSEFMHECNKRALWFFVGFIIGVLIF